MSVLETVDVKKHFGDVRAVDGVDFAIDDDEVVGIIGPNGAGKTTFVNLVVGVLAPDTGTITFDGEDVTGTAVHERARMGLTRSFQIPQVCPELTLLENVRSAVLSREGENLSIFTLLSREDASREEAMELLEQFNMADQAGMLAEEIPHGQRKVLDVCMSLAMYPKVLILDEPTSGVGTSDKDLVMGQIADAIAQTDMAVVFIEHDMEIVAEYSDRVMAMASGRKLVEGDPETVLEDDQVKRQIRGIDV